MSLREEVLASFRKKGLKFVSLGESAASSRKSTLVYVDGKGKTVTKDIDGELSDVDDTICVLAAIDTEEIANFLLK